MQLLRVVQTSWDSGRALTWATAEGKKMHPQLSKCERSYVHICFYECSSCYPSFKPHLRKRARGVTTRPVFTGTIGPVRVCWKLRAPTSCSTVRYSVISRALGLYSAEIPKAGVSQRYYPCCLQISWSSELLRA